MINIIYGLKGSGKTQKIIDAVNLKAESSKGNVVYITDQSAHSLYIAKNVRFVDITKYNVTNDGSLAAFIEGLLAGNYDITDIYVDGPAKFTGKKVEEMEEFYNIMQTLSSDHNVEFTFTVSVEEVPDYMKKYL